MLSFFHASLTNLVLILLTHSFLLTPYWKAHCLHYTRKLSCYHVHWTGLKLPGNMIWGPHYPSTYGTPSSHRYTNPHSVVCWSTLQIRQKVSQLLCPYNLCQLRLHLPNPEFVRFVFFCYCGLSNTEKSNREILKRKKRLSFWGWQNGWMRFQSWSSATSVLGCFGSHNKRFCITGLTAMVQRQEGK